MSTGVPAGKSLVFIQQTARHAIHVQLTLIFLKFTSIFKGISPVTMKTTLFIMQYTYKVYCLLVSRKYEKSVRN